MLSCFSEAMGGRKKTTYKLLLVLTNIHISEAQFQEILASRVFSKPCLKRVASPSNRTHMHHFGNLKENGPLPCLCRKKL